MTAEPAPDEVKSVPVTLEIVTDDRPRRGRPRIMTLRLFLEVCHGVEHGQAITHSCESAGVGYRSFRQHVAESPRLQERMAKAMEQRQAVRREEALECIRRAIRKDNWLAAGWFLERNWPAEFALRNVNRPEQERDEPKQALPAVILEKHRELQLQLLKEDAEGRATVVSSSLASIDRSGGIATARINPASPKKD